MIIFFRQHVSSIDQFVSIVTKVEDSVNFMQVRAPDVIRQILKATYCRDRCAKENILNKGSKRLTDSIR